MGFLPVSIIGFVAVSKRNSLLLKNKEADKRFFFFSETGMYECIRVRNPHSTYTFYP